MHWSAAEKLDETSHQPLDPYVQWAAGSGWRGYSSINQFDRHDPEDGWITFLAELSDAALVDPIKNMEQLHDRPMAVKQEQTTSAGEPFKIYIPFVYRQVVPGSTPPVPSRFFTGRIQQRHLGQLRHIRAIARWELAQPVGRPDDGSVATRGAAQQGPADDAEQQIVKSCIQRRRQEPLDSNRSQLLGIIDSGCAFLHPAFRDTATTTRIVQFWDQGVALKPQRSYWSPASHFGYGSVLWKQDIDRLLALHATPGGQPRDELRTYKALAHMVRHGQARLPVRRAMHGTHVMDVLAGCRNPWHREEAPDPASSAPLAFVQLPRKTLSDGSGGSLGAHMLDAVRQLMTLVKPTGKLLISISQGTHAGPHDGSSMIERALDELLELRKNNFAIVVGAGNARNSDCHAQVEIAPGQTVELALRIPPRDTTDSFAELWYPRQAADGSAHELSMQLEAPAGEVGPWVPTDHVSTLSGAFVLKRPAVAALIHAKWVANGVDAMALIALAPSSSDSFDAADKTRHAPSGVWKVRIENRGQKHCLVHAWSERDQPIRPPWRDYPRWLARPASPTAGEPFRVNPDQTGTLSSLATSEHVLVAGALVVASRKPAGYSSLGPPRGGPRAQRALPTPNVLAAADTSRQLPGVRAAAVQAGDTVRMSGTSVAAPTLARQLFNKLVDSQQPIGRHDWQDVIDDLVQATGPNGHFLDTTHEEED